jgi:hypothetical protein
MSVNSRRVGERMRKVVEPGTGKARGFSGRSPARHGRAVPKKRTADKQRRDASAT